MIGAAHGHHFHSSRRAAVSASKRLLADAMGIELHDRRVPGLIASVAILAMIGVFTVGLLWGPLDRFAGWLLQVLR